eukprot:1152526-Pelagomonas_calceolata.AAC.3
MKCIETLLQAVALSTASKPAVAGSTQSHGGSFGLQASSKHAEKLCLTTVSLSANLEPLGPLGIRALGARDEDSKSEEVASPNNSDKSLCGCSKPNQQGHRNKKHHLHSPFKRRLAARAVP